MKKSIYIFLNIIVLNSICISGFTQYKLPFRAGYTIMVMQNNLTTSTHLASVKPDAYAYDFSGEIGLDVVAARDGIVIAINTDEIVTSGSSGYPEGICSQVNYVWIDHGDATTIYMHLREGSVVVEPGDEVKQGEKIGEVGNTGCSSGAHLHFAVLDMPEYTFGDNKNSINFHQSDGSITAYNFSDAGTPRSIWENEIYGKNGTAYKRQSIEFLSFDDGDVVHQNPSGQELIVYNNYTSGNYYNKSNPIDTAAKGAEFIVSIHGDEFVKTPDQRTVDEKRSKPLWHPDGVGDMDQDEVEGVNDRSNGGYHSVYIYKESKEDDNHAYSGTWRPDIPADWEYQISAYIPNDIKIDSLFGLYKIYHGGEIDTIVLAQTTPRIRKGQFVSLGTYELKKGKTDCVSLSPLYSMKNNIVVYDALKYKANIPYKLKGKAGVVDKKDNKKVLTTVSLTYDGTRNVNVYRLIYRIYDDNIFLGAHIQREFTFKNLKPGTITEISRDIEAPDSLKKITRVEVAFAIQDLVFPFVTIFASNIQWGPAINGCGNIISCVESGIECLHTLWIKPNWKALEVELDPVAPVIYEWYQDNKLYQAGDNLQKISVALKNASYKVVAKQNDKVIKTFSDELRVDKRNCSAYDNGQYPCSGCTAWNIGMLWPEDPNDIQGPEGYGPQRWIPSSEPINYTIRFENDPELATTTAQRVKITYSIPENIDPYSFRIGTFGFANMVFQVPDDKISYTTQLNVTDSLNVRVDITAGVDILKNQAYWIFQTIDPLTGRIPESPTAGFLPVNDDIFHRGEGFVTFSILSENEAITGDTAFAKADIVFDFNEPLATNTTYNTLDAYVPTSSMELVSDIYDTAAVITLTHNEAGSGLDYYDIYLSEDGDPFELWATTTDDTLHSFIGKTGHYYGLFSLATDHAGNKEEMKTDADVTLNFPNYGCNKPVNPVGVVHGLKYEYFEGVWDNLPLLDTMQAIETGIVSGISAIGRNSATDFAFRFTGYLYVSESGMYTFCKEPDTKGCLNIDNVKLAADIEDICLQKGYHILTIDYYQKETISDNGWQIKGPWMNQQQMPDNMFYYLNTAPEDIILSAHSIAENLPAYTYIGSLQTSDAEGGPFNYTLDASRADNSAFIIDGDSIFSNRVFDYETQSEFIILVGTQDNAGLDYQKTLAVQIVDVDESSGISQYNEFSEKTYWPGHPDQWVKMYPIPAIDNTLTISYLKPENGEVVIQLKSIQGAIIRSYKFNKTDNIFNETIKFKGLRKGLIMVEIIQNGEKYTQIIVN